MDNAKICEIFPAFNEIEDANLKALSLKAMSKAMEVGGWNERNIHVCPVTLNWKNCDVTLVEHVNDVTAACINMYDRLKENYAKHGVTVSRDVVVAGALLHDIGKMSEFVYRDGKAVHGDNFKLMRHPLAGAVIAASVGLPSEIVHLIATHSFEGDKSYQTPESELVRTIDMFIFKNSVLGLEKI